MSEIYLHYLNHLDVQALAMTDAEIVAAVEDGLLAQGRGETTIEPRMHLVPEKDYPGHFNVLRGYIAPLGLAGVKVVGDYVDNYQLGLPSEMAILNLFDPKTGMPKAILDATAITDMRTGAMTALGAKYLARKGSKVLGHVGARGTAYWNVRLLNHLFDFDQIRVHSKRPESRDAFAARLSADLGKKVIATETWEDCLKDADIMDKMVVDDWGQCRKGLPFGALRAHVDSDRLTEANLHAELGQIVAGKKPGRERDDETILFWHRGLSLSDIALGAALLDKAARQGLGQTLRFR